MVIGEVKGMMMNEATCRRKTATKSMQSALALTDLHQNSSLNYELVSKVHISQQRSSILFKNLTETVLQEMLVVNASDSHY